MHPTTGNSKTITTLDEFLDNVIQYANEQVDHDTKEFMSRLHGRILKSKRLENTTVHDNVLKAYFEIYALLRQETASRTRIISTAEGVIRWMRT